jgi:hypothetical protein
LKLSDAAGEIYSGLLDLMSEGGPGNFMVVSAGDIYVQFAGSPGNSHILCESISNEYLPKKSKMSKKDIEALKGFGFVLGGDQIENFSRSYEIPTEAQARELADLTVRILREVYGVAPDGDLQIELSLE